MFVKNRCVILAALSLAPFPVLAELDFYVGAGVSATNIDSSGLVSALDRFGLAAAAEMDKTAFGAQIFAGVDFTRRFGVEVKYSDSGEADDTIAVTDSSSSDTINVEAGMDGFTVYGTATFPFPRRAEAAIKLGYTYQDLDVTVNAMDMSAAASNDDDGVAVAGLLRIRFGDHWAVTGELEYWAVDFDDSFDEPLRFSINGEFRF